MSLPTRHTLNLTFSRGLSLEGGVAGVLRRLGGDSEKAGALWSQWTRVAEATPALEVLTV